MEHRTPPNSEELRNAFQYAEEILKAQDENRDPEVDLTDALYFARIVAALKPSVVLNVVIEPTHISEALEKAYEAGVEKNDATATIRNLVESGSLCIDKDMKLTRPDQ